MHKSISEIPGWTATQNFEENKMSWSKIDILLKTGLKWNHLQFWEEFFKLF